MDGIGLALSAALVAAVFVVFELAVRTVCDAIDDVTYSVAPTMLGGLRAWEDGRKVTAVPDGSATSADEPPPREPGPAPTARVTGDGGLDVPVTRVMRGRSGCVAT